MRKTESRALNRWRQKRRRRRQLKAALAGLLVLAGLLSAAYVLTSREEPPKSQAQQSGSETDPQELQTVQEIQAAAQVQNRLPVLDEETEKALHLLAEKNSRVRDMLEHREAYPDSLLKLLARNGETLDFVLHYPEKKDQECGRIVGSVTKGTVPLLLQWDERWGYSTYGDGFLAVTGCGPTALSMVVAGVTGRNDVTPAVIADYAMKHHYYVYGTGTSWDLMRVGCQKFGVKAMELSLSETVVLRELKAENPIICSMRPGDFTTTGHFIVLAGYENGKIRVCDPNSKKRSEQLWDYERLASQINNLWVYTKK